jgi:hypothetical protein
VVQSFFLFLPLTDVHSLVSWLGMASPSSPYACLGDWKGVSLRASPYRFKNIDYHNIIFLIIH